jgi:uncharacterized membrane protein YkoI
MPAGKSKHITEGINMNKMVKLLGATALLAALVPISAYAATTAPTTPAPAAAITTPSVTTEAAEQPGTEKPEAAKAPETVNPAEQAKLAQSAQITRQQAIDTALKQISGTVKDVSFDDENGVIVYNVQIVDASGKVSEVKVDAKTGSIAPSNVDHNDGGNDGETNDGN